MSQLLSEIISSEANKPAFTLCSKIIANILSNPTEPKYRRINLEGKAGAKIVAVAGLVEYFKENGFVESEGHLEFPQDAPMEPLILASTAIESKLASLDRDAPSPVSVTSTANLSLKQKALLQQEQLKIEARLKAKKLREDEISKLEQDKLVRKRDANWSAQAAGVKGGKPIQTYRGKFGEEEGGG